MRGRYPHRGIGFMTNRPRAVLIFLMTGLIIGSVLGLAFSNQKPVAIKSTSGADTLGQPSSTTTATQTRTSVSTVMSPTTSAASITTSRHTWSRGADLLSPRAETAAVIVEDQAYVIGGFGPSGTASNRVEIYNITSDTWRAGNPLPVAVHHEGAVVLGGKIYVIGGHLEGWIPTANVWVYDLKSDTWSAGASMPTKRAALTVQAIDEKSSR